MSQLEPKQLNQHQPYLLLLEHFPHSSLKLKNRKNGHTSKYIESVIYEPLPPIVLSRSTYKITSFIEFAPYMESFKKFERFLNRFTRDLDNPDFVGPLYNIN